MQVSCGQCGMRYEFDAAEIPADGYDAQCSNCNNVFFVSPEAPVASADDFAVAVDDAHVIPQVSEQVAIACPQCNALYQFDSLDVPEAGYDAQCTQCACVFLVAPHTVSPYQSAAVEPAAQVEDETSFASVNALLGQADEPEPPGKSVTRDAPRASSREGFAEDDEHTKMTPRPDLGLTPYESVSHTEPTKVGFSPQLLDGGTFERTDPQMRVPEGFGASAVRRELVAQPSQSEAHQDTVVSPRNTEPHEEHQDTVVSPRQVPQPPDTPQPPEMPAAEVTRTHVTAAPYVDETRNTVISHEPEAPQAQAPEPEHEEPAPLPETAAWTSAAEHQERLTVEPTNPAMVLRGPGSTGERLPTGTLPPDADGESQRLRTAPMEDIAAARRARRDKGAEGPPPGRILRAVVMVLVPLLGGLYFVWLKRPELVAELFGAAAGQNHAITGEAVALFEQGKKVLLRDTDADYEAAIETFGKALQQDAQYGEAQAWQVVAHSLRGADLRSDGARMYAEWEQEQALWRGLKALERQGTALSPDQTTQAQQLEEQGPKHLQAATDTLERGGKELSIAQVQAQRARSLLPRSAPVAAAAALCYTETPNDMAVAQSLLGQYGTLAAAEADASTGKATAKATDVWLLLAQGRVAAAQEKTRDEARAAFNKALEVEPNLVRARWELAQLDAQAGATDDAKKRYQEILAAVPNHPKTMAALAALERPKTPAAGTAGAAPSAAPAEAPAPEAEGEGAAESGENPNAEAPPPKRWRHRRRPPPPAAGAPREEPSLDAPAPAAPDNENE